LIETDFRERAGNGGIKMSKKAKIALIIAIIAIAAAAVVAVLILTGGNAAGEAESQSDDQIDVSVYEDDEEEAIEEDESAGAGTSQPDAPVVYNYNDLSTAIADIPKAAALDEMYILLEGYWITESNAFVAFIFEGGAHAVEFGMFQTSWGLSGPITGGRGTGKYEGELVVSIPARPPNEMDDGYPASKETIYIDIAGLYEPNSSIRVKIGKLDNGQWNTYTYGGSTLDNAFETWYY